MAIFFSYIPKYCNNTLVKLSHHLLAAGQTTIAGKKCKILNHLLTFKATLKMSFVQVQKKNQQYFIYNLILVFELQILVLELFKRSWVL